MCIPPRLVVLLCLVSFPCLWAGEATISGELTDLQNRPVAGAKLRLSGGGGTVMKESATNPDGRFVFLSLAEGTYHLSAAAAGFDDVEKTIRLGSGEPLTLDLRFASVAPHTDTVTVTADVKNFNIQNPDPGQRILVRDEILDANPGRPGAPVSIPGLPIETASSGIKAPQYFAPGVAGDHGEPIATFFLVGTFLVPNNLSANAHGNGYSDPNPIIPSTIESVQVDGGAFNVREGNHSVTLADVYGFHSRLEPYATLTGDYRDVDLTAGWSPAGPDVPAWIAIQASFGNGFLDTLEH